MAAKYSSHPALAWNAQLKNTLPGALKAFKVIATIKNNTIRARFTKNSTTTPTAPTPTALIQEKRSVDA